MENFSLKFWNKWVKVRYKEGLPDNERNEDIGRILPKESLNLENLCKTDILQNNKQKKNFVPD